MLLNDDVLDEADSVAKRVVELAIRVSGPGSNDAAKALTNLAIVQHRTRQYDAARQNFQSAVDIIEENEDRLNSQLINPLKGLGASQLALGRPDLASETYGRAIHVTHVNEGPHNLAQVDLLESLAEVSLRLGEVEQARELQDQIYSLTLRHHDGDLLGVVPSLMRRAAWQRRAGFIFDERTTYRRVINIIEDEAGENDLQLIEPLTRLGQSYFYVDLSGASSYQPSSVTSGEIYFKRAVRIAEDNPDSDWKIQAGATLALGDYYMFQGSEQRARNVYREVWDLLSDDEERLDFRRETLETVNLLRQTSLPEFVGEGTGSGGAPADDALLQGRITLSYKVSSRGRATGLRVVEARPEEFTEMLMNVQREVRRRVFRPIFTDGEPVTSEEQLLTHRFYYSETDLEAIRNAPATAEEPEESAEAEDSETT
jgi:tetratricopeptide (TPR) repeat protein